MSFEIKGKITQLLEIESGTSKAGNDWKKQEFVIETNDQYPKKICFTLFGDKIDLLNGFSQGEEVNVFFNIESREYNGRWFHNINAWKIEKTATEQTKPSNLPPLTNNDIPPAPPEPDDLPF
jgi:hypothetical protein